MCSASIDGIMGNLATVNDKITRKVENGVKTVMNKQFSGAEVATAMTIFTVGSALLLRGKSAKIKKLTTKVSQMDKRLTSLSSRNKAYSKTLLKLQEERNVLTTQLSSAETKIRETEQRFTQQIQNLGKPDEELVAQFRDRYANMTIPYDPPARSTVPTYQRDPQFSNYEDLVIGTSNNAHIQRRFVPEIVDGKLDYTIPESPLMKITKSKTIEFTPHTKELGISEEYADAVAWDNNKIARDILQNFFDGHGQTLDGVRIKFEPLPSGKTRVRIEGRSTYTPDKAVYIGKTGKAGNDEAAGGFGEGLKMASLKLIRDKGAESVRIASDNWEAKLFLAKGQLSSDRLLSYSIQKAERPLNGNFIEFETSDSELLSSIRATVDRFKHSGNVHFRCPEFENDHVMIKILPRGEKGAIYIAGQRFEFNGDFDGLENNVVISIKKKPPKKIWDPSRDRTTLNEGHLGNLAGWLAQEGTTVEEKFQILKTLEPYMEYKQMSEMTPMHTFVEKFMHSADGGAHGIGTYSRINWPEKFVANTGASEDMITELRRNGWFVCNSDAQWVKMRTIKSAVGEMRAHIPVKLSTEDRKKVLILRDAIKELTPALEKHGFTVEEIDAKIHVFDRFNPLEDSSYRDTLGEAIIFDKKSKGFWIDQTYLRTATFSEVLETALHELCHKAGGDSTASFSYLLTDVNKSAINSIVQNRVVGKNFSVYDALWNELKTTGRIVEEGAAQSIDDVEKIDLFSSRKHIDTKS